LIHTNFGILLDRNGLFSCAERSAQWPILAPQAISQSLWQPSRSSGFLDSKHLSPPTYKSNGEVCSWWSGRNTEPSFLCGNQLIEVGGKTGELLVFKRITKKLSECFSSKGESVPFDKRWRSSTDRLNQLDWLDEQMFRLSPKCSDILLDFRTSWT